MYVAEPFKFLFLKSLKFQTVRQEFSFSFIAQNFTDILLQYAIQNVSPGMIFPPLRSLSLKQDKV